MIRKRISKTDDLAIFHIIVSELIPYSRKSIPDLKVNYKSVKQRLNRSNTIVFTSEKRFPVGFVSYVIRKGALVIDMLAVDGKYQNKGIGTQLLDIVEKNGKKNGCRELKLWVDDSNPKALSFYLRNGYFWVKFVPSIQCHELAKSLVV